MSRVQHLASNCAVDEIIEVLEKDGVVIVDDFVSEKWLKEFNSSVQTSIDAYVPYDYGEEGANDFLGYKTVRLNGLIGKAPCYADLIVII